MNENGFKLLTAMDFILDLKIELEKVPAKINMTYFRFVNEDQFEAVKDPLITALKKGTECNLYIDAVFSRIIVGEGVTHKITPKSRNVEKNLKLKASQMRHLLVENGAKITFTNEPSFVNKVFLPFTKRDHRKLIFLEQKNGEKIAYFGASNFDDGKKNDYMVKTTDPHLVSNIEQVMRYYNDDLPSGDIELKCTDNCTLLFDRGKHFKSVIYEKATEIVENAKEKVVFASQYPPEPTWLLKLIKARKNGAEVEIILPSKSHPQVSGFPNGFIHKFDQILCKKYGIKITYSSKGFIHAKLLRADNYALVGSHNLSVIGIIFGTAECSALINDKKFIAQLDDYIETIK